MGPFSLEMVQPQIQETSLSLGLPSPFLHAQVGGGQGKPLKAPPLIPQPCKRGRTEAMILLQYSQESHVGQGQLRH